MPLPKYNINNSGYEDSFHQGDRFQDFVCIELFRHGIVLCNINTREFQRQSGENLQGFEIKLDNRCTETKRLSIEIAEKIKADDEVYLKSGIYKKDNGWMYIQGNFDVIYIFSLTMLKLLHKSKRYEIHKMPTIVKYYLPLEDADRYCARKLKFK